MRKRGLLLVAAGLAAAALALTCARWGATAPPPAAAPVTLIPVVHLKASSDMRVEIEFENTSSHPIKYLEGGRGHAWVNHELLKDGRSVEEMTEGGPILASSRVRELNPGQRLSAQSWDLRDRHQKLAPGRYLFVARYRSGSDFGLTPMDIEQKVYVIIEK